MTKEKKLFRCLAIAKMMQNKKWYSTLELANIFNVHQRSIMRDLNILDQAGWSMITSTSSGAGRTNKWKLL
jgi:predicted DNA-binding transcriptional regulator YafY